MNWGSSGVVVESLRVLGLGMAGILATSVLFMLLTVVLRRAFPPASETVRGRRSDES